MGGDLDSMRRDLLRRMTQFDFSILTADEATVIMRRLGLVGDSWPVSLEMLAQDLGLAHSEIQILEQSALRKIRIWEEHQGPYYS